MAPCVVRRTAEQASATQASISADTTTMAVLRTTSPDSTPPRMNDTPASGRVATISRTTKATEAKSLPIRIVPGPSGVTCKGTSVWRSRSPVTAPAVSPGTMKHTSSSTKNSRVWKTERPRRATSSASRESLEARLMTEYMAWTTRDSNSR